MALEIIVEVAKFLESGRMGCAMWLFTGIIVFLPFSWVNALGIADIVVRYQSWFKLGFVASSVLCIVHAVALALSKTPSLYKRWAIKRKLHHLSSSERQVLKTFIEQDTKTQMFKVTDGIVGGLERAGMLYRASDWMKGSRIAFNMSDWVWDYLKKHPYLLDIDDNE